VRVATPRAAGAGPPPEATKRLIYCAYRMGGYFKRVFLDALDPSRTGGRLSLSRCTGRRAYGSCVCNKARMGCHDEGSRRAWRSRSSRIGIKFIDAMNHTYGV
jgi:hypothetical protein